ncbi:unnamed protein product [Gordionus sp. m RMFG-2023]
MQIQRSIALKVLRILNHYVFHTGLSRVFAPYSTMIYLFEINTIDHLQAYFKKVVTITALMKAYAFQLNDIIYNDLKFERFKERIKPKH